MEAVLVQGEHLLVPERMIVAPAVGVFRPLEPDVVAPDGSEVRLLLGLKGGSLAHFQLSPGEVSVAVRHRTVEEIWFFLAGISLPSPLI